MLLFYRMLDGSISVLFSDLFLLFPPGNLKIALHVAVWLCFLFTVYMEGVIGATQVAIHTSQPLFISITLCMARAVV